MSGADSTLRGCGTPRSAVHHVRAHANTGTLLKLQEMQLMRSVRRTINAVLELRWDSVPRSVKRSLGRGGQRLDQCP